jgi:hypothetical protein
VFEYLWGEALERRAECVHVRVLTPPAFHLEGAPDTLDVPVAELRDWEIELEDGSLEGGFMTRASVAVAERVASTSRARSGAACGASASRWRREKRSPP